MMRSLFPILLLLSTSAYAAVPIKWSETLVKNLNTKTLRQAFCEKNVGYQAKVGCDYFLKNKADLSKKVSSARVEGSSLFLTIGKRQVEIKSTAEPTQFEINRKIIDLKEYRDPAALAKVLKNAFPKVANGSLWMSVAYAQDDSTNVELMTTASLLMLQSTFDERWCGYAERFIKACNSNLSTAPEKTQWEYIAKKIEEKKTLNFDDRRWLQADSENLRVLAYQMKQPTADLGRDEIQKSLRLCPSSNQPPLANAQQDVLKCNKILIFKSALAKEIPAKVDTQQKLLTVKMNNPGFNKKVDEAREEIVAWMEYITSNEATMKTPDAVMEIPVQ